MMEPRALLRFIKSFPLFRAPGNPGTPVEKRPRPWHRSRGLPSVPSAVAWLAFVPAANSDLSPSGASLSPARCVQQANVAPQPLKDAHPKTSSGWRYVALGVQQTPAHVPLAHESRSEERRVGKE